MSQGGKCILIGVIAAVVAFACLGAFVLARGLLTTHATPAGTFSISLVDLVMEAALTGVAVGAIYRLLVRQSRPTASSRSR
jgi:hypothetical protein